MIVKGPDRDLRKAETAADAVEPPSQTEDDRNFLFRTVCEHLVLDKTAEQQISTAIRSARFRVVEEICCYPAALRAAIENQACLARNKRPNILPELERRLEHQEAAFIRLCAGTISETGYRRVLRANSCFLRTPVPGLAAHKPRDYQRSPGTFIDFLDYPDLEQLTASAREVYRSGLELRDRSGGIDPAQQRRWEISTQLPLLPFLRWFETKILRAEAQFQYWENRDLLIRHNTRLVISVAKSLAKKWSLPLEEVAPYGFSGLCVAVDRFEPERGFRFSTKATWWIRQTISRSLRDTAGIIRLPVYLFDSVESAAGASAEREVDWKEAGPDALIQKPDAESSRRERVARTRGALLFSELESDDRDTRVADSVESTMPPTERTVVANELSELMLAALGQLRPREREALIRFYGLNGEEQTWRQIGPAIGMTGGGAQMAGKRGLEKLQQIFRRIDPKYQDS